MLMGGLEIVIMKRHFIILIWPRLMAMPMLHIRLAMPITGEILLKKQHLLAYRYYRQAESQLLYVVDDDIKLDIYYRLSLCLFRGMVTDKNLKVFTTLELFINRF